MVIKNILLDRDGVINEVVLREGVVSSPRASVEFVIRQEFIEFHQLIKERQLNLFVISNQPDVSRALLPAAELEGMTAQLQPFSFKEIVYCTHDDSHGCNCRKPKPGMILGILDKYGLKKEETVLIGDSKKDILAGQAAGIATIYLRRSYNQQPGCTPEFMVDNLGEILGIITF
jgi:D-glycero-D-manno-heptose 1,7-bisphosphate phosphatase